MNLAKKTKEATFADMKSINAIIKRVKARDNVVKYNKVDEIENLKVIGVSDASFSKSKSSVGGSLIMLGSKYNSNVAPLYWKSRVIKNVCISSKDAETRAGCDTTNSSIYMANKLEKMLFGNVKNRIPVDVMTDSLPLLTSIASTKRVENLNMVNTVELMKEKMLEQEVASYLYVNTRQCGRFINEI